ncbi:MAG: AAA family ATPase [Anaerolineae bacterium]
MIPIRLQVRNFLAYRDMAPLDFSGIHVAVLTGENGAGKSSLLEAMTWALWGKARTRRDDDLIHMGQSEMEAEFTFGLGNEVYRVLRKRASGKRGKSELHFHVLDAGGWRTLNETSLRATQAKLDRLLRLDYDTFINSAFLLQGRADEFTAHTPGERKRILGDILGLGIYDEYEDRAKGRVRAQEMEIRQLLAQIEQIEAEIAQEPAYRAELEAAEEEAAELGQALQAAETTLTELRHRHREMDLKHRQLNDLRERLAQTETDLADTRQAVEQTEAHLAGHQAILDRRAEIEAGLARLNAARAAEADWTQRLAQFSQLSERKHEIEVTVQEARAALETEIRLVTARIEELQAKASTLETYRPQLAESETTLQDLLALQAEREGARDSLAALDAEKAELNAENRQLKTEMDTIKSRLEQLASAGATCPVCAQPLTDEHRADITAQFEGEGKDKGDRYRDNRARLAAIQEERAALETKVGEMDRRLASLPAVQGQVARLGQLIEEAGAAAQSLKEAQDRRAALAQQLERGEFAPEAHAGQQAVLAELEKLGYDEAAHHQARDEMDALAHFETDHHRLQDAATRQAEEEARLAQDKARLDRLQAQVESDRQRVAGLAQETASFAELTEQLEAASAEADALLRRERLARDKVAAARQKLEYVAKQIKERSKREERLAAVRESQGIYRELQTAFGKKGVQALLIENAIPEIEDEANRLLGRMTNGRMHVRFETQRATKTGSDLIETLDIRIADEIGTRNYELYSGGESFRVNFAIRIALSKLLARRAGASLQTLVIDEGFGTQDAQGRERLVEAIHAIQDEFEKILIITHIDELKDAFPVRIDVWKTPQGSQVAIR